MIGSALSDLLPHAHEKSRSLAGSDGLRSSDELAILTPRVRHRVLPGQRSAVIYRALDLFVRACHEDPKPQKTASERDFSCAAKIARGRTGAFRTPQAAMRVTLQHGKGASRADGRVSPFACPKRMRKTASKTKCNIYLSFFPICNIFMTLRTEY